MIGKTSLILLVMSLVFGLGLGTAQAQREVTVNGNTSSSEILDIVNSEFNNPENAEIQKLQFRNLTLDSEEAAALFLSTDSENYLLHSIGDTLKNEQQVRFRGMVDGNPFETRVEREDDGTLRLRMEGMDVSGMSPEQLGNFLNNDFDRVRIQGLGDERLEIRKRDDGTVRAELRGMDISGYTPEQLMELATNNDLDRLRIRGSGGEKFEFKQRDDGNPRVDIRGMDVSGYTPEQLTNLAKENGLDRLRIRGNDGQRFNIDRKDDGSLRADFRGMDVSGYTPEQLTNLATDKGLDRVSIRGVDKDGNRVRIEYRKDKGIVKWEGAGRGVTEFSRELNDDHGRDRGRDRAARRGNGRGLRRRFCRVAPARHAEGVLNSVYSAQFRKGVSCAVHLASFQNAD